MVFLEALLRISYCADNAGLEVASPTDEVDYAIVGSIVIHPIDRKITAAGVFLNRTETHRRRMPSVVISRIRAECRDLEMIAVEHHDNYPEPRADRHRILE